METPTNQDAAEETLTCETKGFPMEGFREM